MKAFFAYPSSPTEVTQAINAAGKRVAARGNNFHLHLWVENDIAGRPLTDPIFQHINQSDVLFADVTSINFNVTFEVGYAIGLGKRVYITRNSNLRREVELIDKIGIFDTLGYESYANEEDLAELILQASPSGAIRIETMLNVKAPIFVLNTPSIGQAMLTILSRIKKARLGFRNFFPQEEPRLSAIKAVNDVSTSLGVVIPLLSKDYMEADVHNIRAAFIAGLALGMGKVAVILQPFNGPAPLDVRDIVKPYNRPEDIAELIGELALDVTERLQAVEPFPVSPGNFLAQISLGDPIAENEFQTLGKYFLRTDEFGRASRGEVNLVVGRKGTGKTALFSQLRNEKRENAQNIVVDLKPEGYQLIRLKEDVLDFLAEGARTHLITAFFEYVLYLEICYKVLEKDRERHTRDGRLYGPYRRLLDAYESGEAGEGDFSERLLSLSRDLVAKFQKDFGSNFDQRLTAQQVTGLIYKHNVREVREALSTYLRFKREVWVLFDNLDKGWSPHGITSSDTLILRSLIDAARKIQREVQKDGHNFHCVVFVRNDVYQLLVETSADYGKESRAALDWGDADLLRELIRRRVIQNDLPSETTFDRVWSQICVSHYNGEETSQYLIDRSLMRPRNLLKMLAHCRGFAVNLGRERIEHADLEKGLRAYSLDLITEADQELTDILGSSTNLLYHFIGEGDRFNRSALSELLRGADILEEKIDSVIEFLLYYGFLGIHVGDETSRYIFDVGYDMKLLKVLLTKHKDAVSYVLNPAFSPALNM